MLCARSRGACGGIVVVRPLRHRRGMSLPPSTLWRLRNEGGARATCLVRSEAGQYELVTTVDDVTRIERFETLYEALRRAVTVEEDLGKQGWRVLPSDER
jgi:hypothetical protein